MSAKQLFIIIYAAVNAAVLFIYGADKRRAVRKKRRVPEKTLLTAAVFGVFGALCGMVFFHHKTKKPKFFITVPLILFAEAAAAILFIIDN